MQGESVRALAIAPSNPDVVVAGTLTGVFRSRRRRAPPGSGSAPRATPRSATWSRWPSIPATRTSSTWGPGTCPGRPWTAGGTWQSVKTGMINDSDIFTITLDKRNPQVVYATACSGMYRSFDGGGALHEDPWHPVQQPADARPSRRTPSAPTPCYAGTTEGLWASDDGGGDVAAGDPEDPGREQGPGAAGRGHPAGDRRGRRPAQRRRRQDLVHLEHRVLGALRVAHDLRPGDAPRCSWGSGATATTAACSRRPGPRGTVDEAGGGARGPRGPVPGRGRHGHPGRDRRRPVPLASARDPGGGCPP